MPLINYETCCIPASCPLIDSFKISTLMLRTMMSDIAINLLSVLKSDRCYVAVAHDDLSQVVDAVI